MARLKDKQGKAPSVPGVAPVFKGFAVVGCVLVLASYSALVAWQLEWEFSAGSSAGGSLRTHKDHLSKQTLAVEREREAEAAELARLRVRTAELEVRANESIALVADMKRRLTEAQAAAAGGESGQDGPALPPMRILYEISSSDRGQRFGMRDLFNQPRDKVDTMLEIVDEVRLLCELGHSMSVAVVAAWEVAEVAARFHERLLCKRAGPIPVSFHHFPVNVTAGDNPGILASRHRLVIGGILERDPAIDFVVHVEDDILVTAAHIAAHVEHTARLERRGLAPPYRVGFVRYEVNRTEPGDQHWVWETTRMEDALRLGRAGGDAYLVLPNGPATHQAMWMATVPQILQWNATCRHGFLRPLEVPAPTWVEFWSGAMQIYNGDCGATVKVIPVHDLPRFAVFHLGQNKLSTKCVAAGGRLFLFTSLA